MTPLCHTVSGDTSASMGRVVPFGATREPWRIASLAQRNLARLGQPRVNVLFIGADDVLSRLLAETLELAAPVMTWSPGEPMHLPENGHARTLFIPEVGAMTGAEQVRLLEWLGRAVGRTQVVCTSRFPLMSLVDDGRFINTLYYRLNTVCVDLTATD